MSLRGYRWGTFKILCCYLVYKFLKGREAEVYKGVFFSVFWNKMAGCMWVREIDKVHYPVKQT